MICPARIKRYHSMLLIISALIVIVQTDVPRPRGVSLSKASLYSPTKDFTCFDGTVTIPFSYVNDDYCDCFDGSDEPGTSACLNGIFHCTNAGHRPQNIPSSRVNDGVCDCCDGTDEYATPGLCQDTCEDLGKEARAEAQRLAELYKEGSQLRLDMIENGNKKRNEMAEQLSQLEKDMAEAQKIKSEKENLKNDLENQENAALQVYRDAEEEEKQKKAEEEKESQMKESMSYFDKYDVDKDGMLTKDEVKVINVFDKNKDGEVDEDEILYFFGESGDVDKDTFMSLTWPLLKPLLMMEQGMFKPAEATEDVNNDEESEADDAESVNDPEADFTEHEDDDSDLDVPQEELEVETEPKRDYDEATQKLIEEATEARRQYTAAERAVKEIEANIESIKESLEKDYGLQQEFATLDGQCLEYEDKEYVYRLCVFDKVTQKSKSSNSEIGLGSWGDWIGESGNKYSVMKYSNGVTCWNGPSRSTIVDVNCGLETKLLSVSEPYRCEYKIELITPAACVDYSATQQHSSHDEL